MFEKAKWIMPKEDMGERCPVFRKKFYNGGKVKSARLSLTALGVYEARLNGQRVGEFVLAPGCTAYGSRLQYQTYDVTGLLASAEENCLEVTLGKGWYRGRISEKCRDLQAAPAAILGRILICYEDGSQEEICSDESWKVCQSRILFSDIYDGEVYDASLAPAEEEAVKAVDYPKDTLIPQEGEIICEQERLKPAALLISPKGERILDFGQNFAGYVEISLKQAKAGTKLAFSHAETLDKDGNFYKDNYRSAKAELTYICKEGAQSYKPHFTFFGFRYLRLDVWPEEVNLEDFTGIALYSQMKRTGFITFGHDGLNRLFQNTLWSQRANFIDVPTDCPQRDERMGWTGDAQVFCRTACYHYDAEKFLRKWLGDLRAEQRADGSVPDTVPNFWKLEGASTAWGDVVTIMPWQLYETYGNPEILAENFEAMQKWVDYMKADSAEPGLWICSEEEKGLWRKHYGDWLALDAPSGSYKGSTDDNFIASAFFAHSTALLVKSGKILGRDVSAYEQLYSQIVSSFKKRFPDCHTQTEHVLALQFHLTDRPKEVAAALAGMVSANGNRLQTGFVGTPYLLHVLAENGYTDLAYELLLQEEYPSWLYEVKQGATTIWEHWDGVREDGSMWSADMNSFNHYAYGSVMDWVYTIAGGIRPAEGHPGFEEAVIAPVPSARLPWLKISLETRHGIIRSEWTAEGTQFCYEIEVPVPALIRIAGKEYRVKPGTYVFRA